MKLVNFIYEEKVCLGIKTDEGIVDVKKRAEELSVIAPQTMEELLAMGDEGIKQLEFLVVQDGTVLSEDDIIYAPAIVHPEKILCIGLNYADHAAESKMELPSTPVVFSKFNNALAAHKQDITLLNNMKQVDYEAELVIVIGKEVSNITKEDALTAIFGYTIGNDISARDAQLLTSQWFIGKSCDHFAPVGPYIVTATDINPNNLKISCTVNGEVRQSSNTNQLIFDCATIVSYVSNYMTLKPGDLIFTGTPAGVMLGYPKDKQQWLKPGDCVTVEIEKIGRLTNIFK